MASKIGVLKAGRELGRPDYHVSKEEADQRVLSGAAERLFANLIRMLTNYDRQLDKTEKLLYLRRNKLPPYEIPGIAVKGSLAETYANCRACIVAANLIASTA